MWIEMFFIKFEGKIENVRGNPLILFSRPFGKLKKFPYEGLFPFDRFPFYDYELYVYLCKYVLSTKYT